LPGSAGTSHRPTAQSGSPGHGRWSHYSHDDCRQVDTLFMFHITILRGMSVIGSAARGYM
jgi:hypothetical protein